MPGGLAAQLCLEPAGRTLPHRAGVGPLTIAVLAVHRPELDHWEAKALTSLVGPAPWSRDSGRKRGQQAVHGGPSIVRRTQYLCACSAVRGDGELRRFYYSLRQRGKAANVGVATVMSKLLLQLNAIACGGMPWVPHTS